MPKFVMARRAWGWLKIAPLLQSRGRAVEAIDFLGSGDGKAPGSRRWPFFSMPDEWGGAANPSTQSRV